MNDKTLEGLVNKQKTLVLQGEYINKKLCYF